MPIWTQRNWLITGASAGFGLALAQEVISRGGRVILTARNPADQEALFTASRGRMLVLPLDVTDQAAIDRAIAKAEEFGGVDVLVNNAGYGFLGGVEESSASEVRAQFDTNFFGAAAMMRAVLPGMRKWGGGYIINMSSVAGVIGGTGAGYYSASKWALEGLSESLANEAKPLGIRVLIVEPGAFRTAFFGRSMARPEHHTGIIRWPTQPSVMRRRPTAPSLATRHAPQPLSSTRWKARTHRCVWYLGAGRARWWNGRCRRASPKQCRNGCLLRRQTFVSRRLSIGSEGPPQRSAKMRKVLLF